MPRLGSGGYSGGGGGGGGGVTNNITNNITNVAGLGLEDYGTWTAGANLISTVNNDLLATSIDFPTDDSDYLVTIKDTNTGALGSYIVTQEDFAGITDTVAEVAWNALSATTPDEDNSIRLSHSHNRAAFLGKGVAGKLMIGYTATGVDLTVTLQRIMPADPPASAFERQGDLLATLDLSEGAHARSLRLAPWVLEDAEVYWENYSNANYLEELADDPVVDADSSAGEFYFNTTNEVWRELVDVAGTLTWQDNVDITTLLGTTSAFEGVFADEDAANAAITTPYLETTIYYAYFDSQVQYIRGSTANGIRVVKSGSYGFYYILLPTVFQATNHLGYIISMERGGVPINQRILPFGFNNRSSTSMRGRMQDGSVYYFALWTGIFSYTQYFGIQTQSPLNVSVGEAISFKLYSYEF